MEGNLRVREIRIQNLGTIEDLTLQFHKRVSLVEGSGWKEILLAFRLVCGGDLSETEIERISPGCMVEADVQLDRRRCRILFSKDPITGAIAKQIDPGGEDILENKYLERNVRQYLGDIPEKRRLRVLYDPKEQRIMERFVEYASEEVEIKESVFWKTAGLSATSIFSKLVKENMELCGSRGRNKSRADYEIDSFFQVNRFWEVLDNERGINVGNGPLVLSDREARILGSGLKPYLLEMRKRYKGQLIIIQVPAHQGMGRF